MNHYINMLFILQAKADGHPVEHAVLYSILHTHKDGSAVNEVVKEKMVSVRTYVIHLLGTYVTILCNWLIF